MLRHHQIPPWGRRKDTRGQGGERRGSFLSWTFFPAKQQNPSLGGFSEACTGVAYARHGGGMRTCAWWWRRDGLPLRSLLLLVPPFLLTLQLLLVGPRLPPNSRQGLEGQEDSIAFSIISIEPERNIQQWEPRSQRPVLEAVGEEAVAPAYQDQSEMLSRKVNRNKNTVDLNHDFKSKMGTFFLLGSSCKK